MTGDFDPGEYGRHVAAAYDDVTAGAPPEAVETLVALADGGPVLELGIGTGRLAIPLLEHGLDVTGIDGSPQMVDLLRAKPGGDRIPVVVGDFANTVAGGGFRLAVLAINTVFALPTQDAQVECFRTVARQLAVGGRFVVEAWVPDLGRFRDGRAVQPVEVGDGTVVLEVAEVFPAQQRMRTNKIALGGGAPVVWPAHHRYAWPAELDLMARLAGMRLEHRWGGWSRRPFDDRSTTHVSVYRTSAE